MSLTSVAAPIWNEIAKTQKLRTEWARIAFALDGIEMAELEDKEYETLKLKMGHAAAMGFQDVRPLLMENIAISRYIQAKQDLQLRTALPEVVSITEAIHLASMDRPMTREDQTSLKLMLQAEYNKK